MADLLRAPCGWAGDGSVGVVMSGWQAMDSAPKDGTRFLAWNGDAGSEPLVYFWSKDRAAFLLRFAEQYGGWSDLKCWRHLPELPKVTNQKIGSVSVQTIHLGDA